MNPKDLIRKSKFLSLVLRHRPDLAGTVLDPAGWTGVGGLLEGCARAGRPMTLEELREVVAANDKKRFELSPDGTRIRASQGHSVPVDLGLDPVEPAELLYHGTATRFLASIRKEGLRSGLRQYVHLSPDAATATAVGCRHGQPVVLTVRARAMHRAGHAFFLSANGVWLTAQVPAAYIGFPEE